MKEPVNIGISIGDINGIGPEVILKALSHNFVLQQCTPVVYASSKVVSYHKNIIKKHDLKFASYNNADQIQKGRINVVNSWIENVNINLGSISAEGGKYAYISMDSAVRDLKDQKLDALVTAPIHKSAMKLANFPYQGHTDYLSDQFNDEGQSLMLMVSDALRVGVVTEHIPLKDVAETITKKRVATKLKTLISTLRIDFAIDKPKIAVLGLNPHAGDDGIMGTEEEEIIKPVIIEHKKKGDLVMGPYPADGFFGSGQFKKFDAILAMYHDQGLIPFKTISFTEGVNFTAGLPIVRTSPGHGTAFEIAGKNEADATSFTNALFLAIDTVRNRKMYEELRESPLQKPKLSTKEQVSS